MKTEQTVWYGDIKKMPIAIMQQRVSAEEEKLQELKVELERRKSFTPAMRLADRLHTLLHRTVDCDYHYSDWGGIMTGCRADFLHLANTMLANYTLNNIHAFIAPMEKTVMGPDYAPEKDQL